jgi:phosphinothricin acetyltransferase
MPSKKIRLVQESDSARILEIYRPFVEETAISFEHQIPTQQEFTERIWKVAQEYPYLVYLLDETIVGYAYAHRHMERAAYQWNATLSVYIDKGFQRQGIGRQLYACLMEILKLQNIHNVYGIVMTPNPNSEKLHESFGFRRIGIFQKTGYKHGDWHDVTWFEKSIREHEADPRPFIPIEEIDPSAIATILDRYSQPA